MAMYALAVKKKLMMRNNAKIANTKEPSAEVLAEALEDSWVDAVGGVIRDERREVREQVKEDVEAAVRLFASGFRGNPFPPEKEFVQYLIAGIDGRQKEDDNDK